MVKKRQQRGTGGLRSCGGKYEGTFKVYKQDGTYIEKSFTRNTLAEINDIKAGLRVLGVIENDITSIDIDKRTNKITLNKQNSLLYDYKVQLNKNITVNEYVDYWLWNHRRRGLKRQMIKDSTFEDYVQKCQYIKERLGKIKQNGKEIDIKVADLTFGFMEKVLLDLHNELAHNTVVQIRNHLYNMMKWAKKDGVIVYDPFLEEQINLPEAIDKEEKQYIKESDVEAVIKYCLNKWYVDVITQLMTGFRRSEK